MAGNVVFDPLRSAARTDAGSPESDTAKIAVVALGWGLSLFFTVTFALCVGFDLLFSGQAMHETWQGLLPGFTWLSWPSFFLGLAEVFAYGWYAALIFGPIYNLFAGLSYQPARR